MHHDVSIWYFRTGDWKFHVRVAGDDTIAENRLEKKRLWGKHAMDCWRYPFVVFGLRCKLQTDVLR